MLQTVLIKPEELRANGIEVHKVVQHPGDFIINFPGELPAEFDQQCRCKDLGGQSTCAAFLLYIIAAGGYVLHHRHKKSDVVQLGAARQIFIHSFITHAC